MLLTVFLAPFGQVVVLGGVHFTIYRIVIVFGLARLLTSKLPEGESRFAGGFSGVDSAFTLCALFAFIAFSAQWTETQAIIKGIGNLLDALGGYFVVRFLIRDEEDVRRVIKAFAVVVLVIAPCMITELSTHRNLFGLLGGLPVEDAIRDGKIRAQGPFEVYITAGVFGATLLPLFIWLWSGSKARIAAFLGIIGATIMTVASESSTPLLAYAVAIVGLCFWPFRKNMRPLRWGLVLILVGLHLVMKAPVWSLIARIDLTGSSSGFHRFMLVDQCIRHFSAWWFIGTKNFNEWGADMWDLSNQYVADALTGGLVTLASFIAIISRSFGKLGTARKRAAGDRGHEWLLWCLGAALSAHVAAYFGISYFDQMQFAWYTLLAIIAASVGEAVPAPLPESRKVLTSAYEGTVL
jgi:hypothetical protein